jgi:hypothetical protein
MSPTSIDRAQAILEGRGACLRERGEDVDLTFCALPHGGLLICNKESCIATAAEVPR